MTLLAPNPQLDCHFNHVSLNNKLTVSRKRCYSKYIFEKSFVSVLRDNKNQFVFWHLASKTTYIINKKTGYKSNPSNHDNQTADVCSNPIQNKRK